MHGTAKISGSFPPAQPASAGSTAAKQKDTAADLPAALRGLVEKELVTAQWAAALSELDQLFFSEAICELVEKDLIRPSEVLKLGQYLSYKLELKSSVLRSLLVDRVLHVDQLLELETALRCRLDEPEVQDRLNEPAVRQKIRDGTSTLREIISATGKPAEPAGSAQTLQRQNIPSLRFAFLVPGKIH